MDKNLRNRLLIIASSGLGLASAIFLIISFFEKEDATLLLAGTIGSVLLSHLFLIVRQNPE